MRKLQLRSVYWRWAAEVREYSERRIGRKCSGVVVRTVSTKKTRELFRESAPFVQVGFGFESLPTPATGGAVTHPSRFWLRTIFGRALPIEWVGELARNCPSAKLDRKQRCGSGYSHHESTPGRLHAGGKRNLAVGLPFFPLYSTRIFVIGGVIGHGITWRTLNDLTGIRV